MCTRKSLFSAKGEQIAKPFIGFGSSAYYCIQSSYTISEIPAYVKSITSTLQSFAPQTPQTLQPPQEQVPCPDHTADFRRSLDPKQSLRPRRESTESATPETCIEAGFRAKRCPIVCFRGTAQTRQRSLLRSRLFLTIWPTSWTFYWSQHLTTSQACVMSPRKNANWVDSRSFTPPWRGLRLLKMLEC